MSISSFFQGSEILAHETIILAGSPASVGPPKFRKFRLFFSVFQLRNCHTDNAFMRASYPYDSHPCYFKPAFRKALIKRSLSTLFTIKYHQQQAGCWNVLMDVHALRFKSPGVCGHRGSRVRASWAGRGKVTMRHRLDHGQKSSAALSAFPANRRPAYLFILV